MLLIDLNRLRLEGRARIDADIPPTAALWEGTGLEPETPLEVRLEAQQAGADVVVRGELEAGFRRECRRCLEPVTVEVEEEVGRVYRPAEELAADEPDDVAALPEGAELDLSGLVREELLLAVPRYVTCREDCRGLCEVCGANWNESECDCVVAEEDERWAPLRRLMSDG